MLPERVGDWPDARGKRRRGLAGTSESADELACDVLLGVENRFGLVERVAGIEDVVELLELVDVLRERATP